MNKNCAACGKPVYFAERKTSLGREWHPSCLKCRECGRVLSPGQHAEHKGDPYCHHPCYRALFGPAILGYGSNISSPANFAPRSKDVTPANNNRASTGSIVNSVVSEESLSYTYSLGRRSKPKHHLVHQNSNGLRKDLFSPKNGVEYRTGSEQGATATPSGNSRPTAEPKKSSDAHNIKRSISELPVSAPSPPPVTPVQCSSSPSSSIPSSLTVTAPSLPPSAAATSSIPPSTATAPSIPSSMQASSSIPQAALTAPPVSVNATTIEKLAEGLKLMGAQSKSLQEMLAKLAQFNKFYEGKVHNQMIARQMDDGSVHVEGPLRIYWGLSRPIQLAHCDNIPPAPISQWRHSLHVSAESPVDTPNKSFASMSLRRSGSPARKSRDLDDLLSPTSSDDVVRRKKGGVRKFKTVAYRGGDQPSRWKRASINGHIFNFDTSVFTPVLGSCTSVTVDGTLNSQEVIETLLDKFKVQNNADEYVLSIVNEDGERLLTNRDRPLLERLKVGPDESVGKIFIKEREVLQEDGVGELVVSALDDTASAGDGGLASAGVRRSMRAGSIKMPIRETEEEENLPHEVEQLLVLPEAVLRGLLVKYHNDEEVEVTKIKARYTVAKQRVAKILHEVLVNSTSSTA